MFRRAQLSGLASIFGALELRVMEALWRRPAGASVRELQGDFPNAAYTTVMTTMERLHRKGVLDREKSGRAFVYRARYSREEMETGAAARAVGSLLGNGNAQPILSWLVDAVSEQDTRLLDELERLVQAKRRERDRDR
jgi:predicted transcriptional regulator